MKSLVKVLALCAAIVIPSLLQSASAAPKLLDQVAVRVNESVILQSEIDAMMQDIKQKALADGQSLPRDKVLRTQVIDRLITRKLELQLADRMGIKISDTELDSAIERIAQKHDQTVAELRQQIESQGQSYEQYRNEVREDIRIRDVTQVNVRNRINIGKQEVNNLVKLLKQQGEKDMEVHFGHIMIDVPGDADKDQIAKAKERAEKVVKLLKDGADFKKTAVAASAGPKALEGGDWGFMNINEMPTVIADMVKDAKPGDLVGPVQSPLGFHIVKVFEKRGQKQFKQQEVHARHILLKPSVILSESRAKKMLSEWADEIRQDDSKFAELAKENSDDPGSASQGGDLGWANPDIYAPAFKNTLADMKPGEVSEPFRSQFGWHIIELLGRRTTDVTEQRLQERAYQLIGNRRFNEESERWLRQMREGAYIQIINQ